MPHSATLLYNAGGYAGHDWQPRLAVHVPGLQTTHNRSFWASWGNVSRDGWGFADAWIDEQLAQGIKPILCLAGAPGSGDWYDFMWELAARYRGRGMVYEVGNEFDTVGNWLHGDAVAMGKHWRAAHDAVTVQDPDALVIGGNIQAIALGGNGYRELHAALQGWGDYWPKAVSVHVYPPSVASIPLVFEWLSQVRGVLCSCGAEATKIWVTEWGFSGFSTWTKLEQGRVIRAMFRQFDAARVVNSLMWAADDGGEFGFKDRKVLKRVWNASINAGPRRI